MQDALLACALWHDLKLQIHILPSRNPLSFRNSFQSSLVHSSALLSALCTGHKWISFFVSISTLTIHRNKDCDVIFKSVRMSVKFAPGTTTCSIHSVYGWILALSPNIFRTALFNLDTDTITLHVCRHSPKHHVLSIWQILSEILCSPTDF